MEEQPPKYMMLYVCRSCGQESGFSEQDTPHCRYCEEGGELVLVEKKEITGEVIAERLKSLTNNMMKNLLLAFDNMDEDTKEALIEGSGDPEKDSEKEMLLLLERAKQLRDKIHEPGLDAGEEK